MTINDMVIDTFTNVEIGEEFTTAEIQDKVVAKYHINRSSFQPADMCYNRSNKGLERPGVHIHKIFLWVKRGHYKYVGLNYELNENDHIYRNPRKNIKNKDKTVEVNL